MWSPMANKTIVVMGPTGVGKSSFILDSVPPGTRVPNIRIGHSLTSNTRDVKVVEWVNQDGTTIKLVDTPGFDDTRPECPDRGVLAKIARFLKKTCSKTPQLVGLVYLHRISDNRVGATSRRIVDMLRKLCGMDSLKNVVIVTTMWDEVTQEEGEQREIELQSETDFFKTLLDQGATMRRHTKEDRQSALNILNYVLGKQGTTPEIVREMVNEKKTVERTTAAEALDVKREPALDIADLLLHDPIGKRRIKCHSGEVAFIF
ncbi:hypothetical protein ID866_8919 [Astraeus odoratus]|nr:hypothetical protein ID866_8919 [Astraeus odoratus]